MYTHILCIFGSIQIACISITRLTTALIQNAQIGPRSSMCFVQLHRAYVCLKCVHWLILLLIQHTENKIRIFSLIHLSQTVLQIHVPNRAPRVRIALTFLHRIAIRDESIMHFVNTSKTTTHQIQRLTRFRIRLN